jgi:hypothetical protein
MQCVRAYNIADNTTDKVDWSSVVALLQPRSTHLSCFLRFSSVLSLKYRDSTSIGGYRFLQSLSNLSTSQKLEKGY